MAKLRSAALNQKGKGKFDANSRTSILLFSKKVLKHRHRPQSAYSC